MSSAPLLSARCCVVLAPRAASREQAHRFAGCRALPEGKGSPGAARGAGGGGRGAEGRWTAARARRLSAVGVWLCEQPERFTVGCWGGGGECKQGEDGFHPSLKWQQGQHKCVGLRSVQCKSCQGPGSNLCYISKYVISVPLPVSQFLFRAGM